MSLAFRLYPSVWHTLDLSFLHPWQRCRAFPTWWAQVDSNHRPRAYQARALTTWAMSPCKFSVYLVFLSPYFLLPLSSFAFRLHPSVWHIFVLSLLQPWQRCRAVPTGGDDGNRTHDPLLAGQVLSQLSYTPIKSVKSEEWRVKSFGWKASLFFFPFPLMRLLSFLSVTQNWTTSKVVQESGVSLLSRRLFSYLPTYEYSSASSLSFVTMFSIERRWSSRTFRYGYLVTT